MRERKTTTLSLRLPITLKDNFYKVASREPNQDPADVLRDLITSYLRKHSSLLKEKNPNEH